MAAGLLSNAFSQPFQSLEGKEGSRSVIFGWQDETYIQMYNGHSLYRLKGRRIGSPNSLLKRKWIQLLEPRLAAPFSHDHKFHWHWFEASSKKIWDSEKAAPTVFTDSNQIQVLLQKLRKNSNLPRIAQSWNNLFPAGFKSLNLLVRPYLPTFYISRLVVGLRSTEVAFALLTQLSQGSNLGYPIYYFHYE